MVRLGDNSVVSAKAQGKHQSIGGTPHPDWKDE